MENLKRIRLSSLHDKVTSAENAIQYIHDGMTIAISGFGGAGEAKTVPLTLADHAKTHPLKVTLLAGASLGNKIDQKLNEAGVITKRYPYQADAELRKSINKGDVHYTDMHLSEMADHMNHHSLPIPQIAIIAATAITENGEIIPTESVGNSAHFVALADHIIIEIDESIPESLEGVHDVYMPKKRPGREPIPLVHPEDHIGSKGIKFDPAKVVAIVFNQLPDTPSIFTESDQETDFIAQHIIDFFDREVAAGRLPSNLGPLQSGVGSICNAVFAGLENSNFDNLVMYSEILQDCAFKLIDSGKMKFASACAMSLSANYGKYVLSNFEKYKDKIMLRPQDVSNNPEVIRRLGIIAINTALEFDIYGNVNSTHVLGSKIMNGIGGSGDFARNSHLSIFVTKSIAKNGAISSVVPMVSHVDHTEHDVDILVTEQGLADLRGLSPRQRAQLIIKNCVHPDYQPALYNYFQRACLDGGQTPHILNEALSWHVKYQQTGTMQEPIKEYEMC